MERLMAAMSTPVVVWFEGSTTLVYQDGSIERRGEGRPVAELLGRLQRGPAALVARDPAVVQLVRLLEGRIDFIDGGDKEPR